MSISGEFEVIAPLIGGALIGLGAAVMLLFSGRIAGISGVIGGMLPARRGEAAWRGAFVAGLALGGLLVWLANPARFVFAIDRSMLAIAAAGLLVGFGTRLGNGCTSGHGVCGISRLSRRSILATGVFMGTGAATVYVVGHLLGGAA